MFFYSLIPPKPFLSIWPFTLLALVYKKADTNFESNSFIAQCGHFLFVLNELLLVNDCDILFKACDFLSSSSRFSQWMFLLNISVSNFWFWFFNLFIFICSLFCWSTFILKLILLPVQLRSQFPSYKCIFKRAHLVLFASSFKLIAKLLYVLIKALMVGFWCHLL